MKTPDFHHKPLLLGRFGLTETQQAEECGPHGSAPVRQEAGLSTADRVTGCGRRAVLFSQPDACHRGRWATSSHARDGSLSEPRL